MMELDYSDFFIDAAKKVAIPTAIISVIIIFVTKNALICMAGTYFSMAIFGAIWLTLLYKRLNKAFEQEKN